MTAIGDAGKTKILGQLGREFVRMSKATFGANNTTYRGNKWAKYSKSYTKQVGSSTPTLQRTGNLKNSIRIMGQGKNWISVGSGAKYSKAHMFGNPKSHLPARRFIPVEGMANQWRLTLRAERDMVKIIGKEFSNMSRGALPAQINAPRSTFSIGNPCSGRS